MIIMRFSSASAAILLALGAAAANAQTSPGFSYGQVPTAGQWNAAFASKQDRLTFTPVNRAGDTMTGRLQTAPSTINGSGFALLPGIAPTAPSNGDLWSTPTGFFGRISDQTFQLGFSAPLSTSLGGTGYTSVSAALDGLFSSTQGAMLYRGATAWQALAPGSAGNVLSTGGAGANPSWIPQTAGSTVLPLGQVRLTYSSASALLVKPYNGNQITVNGAYQTVPGAGVTCSNAGLTASTLYYAYLYVSGGTLTCEMVTTTHATGTNGQEIKSGDTTRTLVGMAFTVAGTPGTFADSATQRYVASWFNRQGKALETSVTSFSTSSTTSVALSSTTLRFVTWADEDIKASVFGLSANNTAGFYTQTQPFIDGFAISNPTPVNNQHSIANYYMGTSYSRSFQAAEGVHSVDVGVNVSGNTGTWSINHNAALRQ